MRKYSAVVQDELGNAIDGALIEVFFTGTVNPATIYSDNGVTPIIYPPGLLTDLNGYYEFYVEDGVYDIKATKGVQVFIEDSAQIFDVERLRNKASYTEANLFLGV